MKISNFNVSALLLAAMAVTPASGFVTSTTKNNNPSSSRHILAYSRQQQMSRPITHLPTMDLSPRSNNLVKLQAASINDSVNDIKNEITSSFSRLEGKRRLGFGMAFLTGVSDLALNLKYKCFATMMTGNTMWMALAMVEQRFTDVGFYASVILSYLAGLAVFRQSDVALKKRNTLPLSAFFTAALFVGSDVMFSMYGSRWIPTMMLAMGFGIVNSVGQDCTGTLTFVVTGSLTRMMAQIVDRVSKSAGQKKLTVQDKQGFLLNASIFGGFFCGAAFAGVLKAKGILVQKLGVFSGIGLSYALLFLWKDNIFQWKSN
ncbi:unnamed protein product [Cylindrotheca closterium]|uniref:DUF1275 domain-containing protein n=1 Tax=Cylindrotheca closterium TaxID=2856 RepID=A0AAD2G7T0_9STRA|nr:unnamed protein product [Cylindrotheca closterium]